MAGRIARQNKAKKARHAAGFLNAQARKDKRREAQAERERINRECEANGELKPFQKANKIRQAKRDAKRAALEAQNPPKKKRTKKN